MTIYCERSITVTLSRTVFINRNLFTSSILFIWLILATLYFSSSTSCWVSLMAYSTSAAPLLSFQIVGYYLAFLPKEPFLFFNRQSLLICGHLLLILSCLIRDLGGSSRSSGCEDDKWIARLEKWTQIHPLLEFVFTSMHCSSSRIMDGMVGTSKVQHRIPINS